MENETVPTAGLSDYRKLLPFTIEITQSEGGNSHQSRACATTQIIIFYRGSQCAVAFWVEFSWWRRCMPSELVICRQSVLRHCRFSVAKTNQLRNKNYISHRTFTFRITFVRCSVLTHHTNNPGVNKNTAVAHVKLKTIQRTVN